jgi:chromosomal replication initiation ATPase DnaA
MGGEAGADMNQHNTSAGARQLTLALAHRPALGAEDFFLSRSNELAVALIDSWPDWPQHGQLLLGPAASGKTHLVNVWRLRSGAAMIPAQALAADHLQQLDAQRPLAVEDIDRGIDEELLFHLLNRMREGGGHLLLTARTGPAGMAIALKDLRSRLLALPQVGIEAPDDDLLRAVIIKQFADRQIEVDPPLIDYLMKRIERSLETVVRVVETLDRATLGTGRRITRQLARDVLGQD